MHASPAWSARTLRSAPEDVAPLLLGELFAALGIPHQQTEHLHAHRWSFARPVQEARLDCLWEEDRSLAVCGDWCLGGRVEGAYLSGVAAAERVLETGLVPRRAP